MAAKFFTLEEATALLPQIRTIIERQNVQREAIEADLNAIGQAIGGPPESLAELESDSEAIRQMKQSAVKKLEQYQQGWEELEALGVVLKDARIGLVDFLSHVEGKAVFLCWKYGEERIEAYHDLDTGFSGRKPLLNEFRSRMYN